MKDLYQVFTKRYKRYYVLAYSYDEAIRKAENALIEEDGDSILTEDGSLKEKCDIDVIREVSCLTAIDGKLIM